MIYLDYSATTKADSKVLDEFKTYNYMYFANANSVHALGKIAEAAINNSSERILELIGSEKHEIIYTSGATESNNLAIKGIALKYQGFGKHIITSYFEHSSVVSCLNYLTRLGFKVDFVESDEFGRISPEAVKKLITDETILVTIAAINSETGLIQDVDSIGKMLSEYENIHFHSDMTQAFGKTDIDISYIDLVSFSAHKFYGIKGIGGLFVRKGTKLEPVIHGGRSTTMYRAGTPATPLILSLAYSLDLAYRNLDSKLETIKEIHDYLIGKLQAMDSIHINSNEYSIPQIVNVSFTKILAHDLHKYLSDREIYISTQTACASDRSFSQTIKRITGSDLYAETSVRISLSHFTTKSEIDELIKTINEALSQ